MADTLNLDRYRRAVTDVHPVTFRNVHVTAAEIDGRRVLFATDKKQDPIQRAHRKGQFYERDELAEIADVFPQGGTFVDIGANVGNHGLYAGLFLGAAKVVPFEPNPLAYKLLLANVALNGLQEVYDLAHLGLGVSDEVAQGFGMTEQVKNLGGARMVQGSGEIATTTGDAALAGVTPDFIKIDVEGMEMGVLRGLEETIARTRPRFMIEVDRNNDDAFHAWVSAHDYRVLKTIAPRRANTNYFLAAREALISEDETC